MLAADLRFSLTVGALAAGEGTPLTGDGPAIELVLLPGGHRAVVRVAGEELCETVGALDEEEAAVPGWLERHDGPARYVFRSWVHRAGAAGLRDEAARLRAQAALDPEALVATGEDDGLCVVSRRPLPGGVGWAAWHVRPAAGQVVRTRSRLVVAATAAG